MSLSNRQQTLIDDLLLIEDAQERLSALVDQAKRRPSLPESDRTEAARVTGCQSQVWIVARHEADRVRFQGDSDSPLVRGLVVFTCDFFSDEPADSLAHVETIDPLTLAGLTRNLSGTRQAGLASVRHKLKTLALPTS